MRNLKDKNGAKVHTGRPFNDFIDRKVYQSKRGRGDLVQVSIRVTTATYKYLRDVAEIRHCSMGEALDYELGGFDFGDAR